MTKNRLPRHSFWGESESPIAIAHRGGGALYGAEKHLKENTMEAFLAVSKLGYEYLELDVIKTVDDKVIVVHVAKNRLEALIGKKDAPNLSHLEKMTHKQIEQSLEREIPTIKSILEEFPDNKFLIDAKSDSVVRPLAEVILESKTLDRVCVGSFYPRRVETLRQLLGDGACLRLIISRSPWHLRQQLRFLRNKAWQKTNFVFAVDWPYIFINRWTVRMLHDQDLKVLAWVPNSKASINKSLEAGADGIISDRAGLLKEILVNIDPNNSSITHNA